MMNIKLLIWRILDNSPRWLKKPVQKFLKKRKRKVIADRMESVHIGKEELEWFFDQLPLDGDTIVHASMTNIGSIEGGAEAVAAQIVKKLAAAGNTVLVPALPMTGRVADYLPTHPTFDVRTAPIKMGALANRLAQSEETWRSIHPTHSVAALGKDAQWYTSTHHLDRTPFGANSPYYKLLQRGAKMFFFGVGLHYTTYVHVMEDMLGELFPVTIYSDTEYDVDCTDWYGNSLVVHTRVHAPNPDREVTKLMDWFEKGGAIEYNGKLGEGEVWVVDVRKFTIAYFNAMLNGDTIYGRVNVTQSTKDAVKTLLETI